MRAFGLLLAAAVAVSTDAFAPPSRALPWQPPSFPSGGAPRSAGRRAPAVDALMSLSPTSRGSARPRAAPPSALRAANGDGPGSGPAEIDGRVYTPLDRPLLAAVDAVSLVVFAAVGRSSHSPDGALDPGAVLVTALPFIAAWLSLSPLTGVYSPDDRDENILSEVASKVARGWAASVPVGIALRGAIKGYVPPMPFVLVTLISTLVILVASRLLFSIVEDFFVELVN